MFYLLLCASLALQLKPILMGNISVLSQNEGPGLTFAADASRLYIFSILFMHV